MYDFSWLGRSILYHYLHIVCTSCTSYNDVLRPYKCTTDVLLQASILALFSGMHAHSLLEPMETPSAPLGFNHNYIPLDTSPKCMAILQVHHLCSLNQNYSSYCHRTQGNLYPLLQSVGKTVQIFSYMYDTLYHQQYSTSKSLMPCNDCTPTL